MNGGVGRINALLILGTFPRGRKKTLTSVLKFVMWIIYKE
jgi:hypothetical protein